MLKIPGVDLYMVNKESTFLQKNPHASVCQNMSGQNHEGPATSNKLPTPQLHLWGHNTRILPSLDRRVDRVLALSSAVGSKMDHPLCKAFWAANWTVLMTPWLLARETTLCFRLVTSWVPGPRPKCSVLSDWQMVAWNWNNCSTIIKTFLHWWIYLQLVFHNFFHYYHPTFHKWNQLSEIKQVL